MMLGRNVKEFKHIAIVGAGPIGLFLALSLTKTFKMKITLIEERLYYTRPGDVDDHIFEMLSLELKSSIQPSSSYHIKDIERGLEKLIEKDFIDFKRGLFTTIMPGGVEIKTKDHTEKVVCDLVFDATGAKRAVMRSLNKALVDNKQLAHFEFFSVADNPIKTHFIAYVCMDENGIVELFDATRYYLTFSLFIEPHEKLSSQELIGIASLRKTFHWPYFSFPQLLAKSLKKNKALLYAEMPPDLNPLKHEAWLKALIHLFTGKDIAFSYLKVSDKYKLRPKPRFNPIHVQPLQTQPLYYVGTKFPSVIPIGDACLEPDYRLGIGVEEGVSRAITLISCLDKKDNTFSINVEKYVTAIQDSLVKQKDKIINLYKIRRRNLVFESDLFLAKYIAIKSPDDRKLVLQQRITDIFSEKNNAIKTGLIDAFYHKACHVYRDNVLDNEAKVIDREKIGWSLALSKCYSWLVDGLSIYVVLKEQKSKKVLLDFLLDMAKKTRALADIFFNDAQPAVAKKYYKFSLKIYENFFSDRQHQTFLMLCFSIMTMENALKNKNVDIIFFYADKALARLQCIKEKNHPELKEVAVKIIYHKIIALLQTTGHHEKKDILEKSHNEIQYLFNLLHAYPYKKTAERLNMHKLPPKEQFQYEMLIKKILHNPVTLKRKRLA